MRFITRQFGPPLIVAGAILGAVLVIGTSYANALGSGAYEQFGVAVRDIISRPSDGSVLATVNGVKITQRQLDFVLNARHFSGLSTSPNDALETAINNTLVLIEAQKDGISTSDADLASFIAAQRRLANQDPDRSFYRYAVALGLDETTIWSYRPLLDEWRKWLTVGKFRHAVVGDITQTNAQAKNAEWAAYLATLRRNAVITK